MNWIVPAALLFALGCSRAYVDMPGERQKEWRLEVGMVSDHMRLPNDLAWVTLTNDSSEDKLVCLRSRDWGIKVGSVTRGFPGPQGVCKSLDEFQVVRSKASVTVPVRVRLEELPRAGEFEFEVLFPELPWPPFLGDQEWRGVRWKGDLELARKNGRAMTGDKVMR